MDKRGQMPVTEVIAIVLAIIVFAVAVVIAVYFRSYSSSFMKDIWNVISFSWLFGNG